jgi:hypothetical protein
MTAMLETGTRAAARIAALDLDPIVCKLMSPGKDEPGMTLGEADEAVRLYRQFLTLLDLYPDQLIAPPAVVDKVWHAHILDTGKYAADCDSVFGRFIHHFPYFGMRGDSDSAALELAAARTRRLLHQHFGTGPAPAGAGHCIGNTGGSGGKCNIPPLSGMSQERPRPDRGVTAD